MSKYVIKNCGCNPACDECYIRCKDITDCLLKQIVEKCKDAQDECSCKIRNYVKCFECTSGGRAALGKEILELLEIEECENE